jgi:hypothetical protein
MFIRNGVLQADYPFYDGLRMPDLEVRCSLPRPEAASVAIRVSSQYDKSPLVL